MGVLATLGLLCALQLCYAHEYLLPRDVTPRHYDVKLVYDLDPLTNYSFYGVVDILLTVKSPVSKIVLHAQDFDIPEEKISVSGGPDFVAVTEVSLNTTFNLLTLNLGETLQKDQNYTLTIPFYGNLSMGLDGAYISSYVDKETMAKEYLLTTQFEAIHARKAFPCFDEPGLKATFQLTIGHHKNFTAVSNMPADKSSDDNALENYWPWSDIELTFKKDKSMFVWDQFLNSVPMSTYLVAYVVSKFKFVESPADLSTTMFRIWARGDAIDQTEYAAIIGPKVLSYYEKWFNVTFPLPKQDMIAIPDFSAGAMENWGLITYRETALLYDKKHSSFTNKERVAEVIAHELAHQWFGNLVTMQWWSDLWLNEGFATFVSSLGMAAVEPAWRVEEGAAVENMISLFSLDALESSHPVSVPIENPKRINEIFDEISYRKGSALIRMMIMFLGEKVFKEAIHNYLIKYSYNNAEQDDLWRELTDTSVKYNALTRNVTIKTVMDTWTTQTGFPILTVERDYAGNTVTISQKRYLALGAKSTSTASWWVPLSVLCEKDSPQDPAPLQWLAAGEGVRALHQYQHGAASDEWLLFNYDMMAPYRVNYDARNWQLLIGVLTTAHSKVPELGRVQLLSDAFELAWTNRLDYTVALQLASYLHREQDLLPLDTGLGALGKIENVLKRSPDYGAFQKYVRKLVGDTYQRVGGLATKSIQHGDDLISVKMQLLTSNWACRVKVPGCEENAIELFDSWMNTENPDENNPIPLDLRRVVCCVALARGGVRHWRFVVARRRRENVAAAREALQHALSCTRDVWLLNQYLEWAVTDGPEVRRQDSDRVIGAVIRSTVGYYVGKEFVYSRIDDIYKAVNKQGRRIGGIVKSLLDQFTTQRELDEFEAWRANNGKYLEDATLSVQQAVEKARVNIAWLARNRRLVVDALRDFSL